ncbi:hypothetical protein AAVH_33522 [Aphelenchoides avenae]|nr:hypothetical protein AAVH_33522 [Aphelenchus avenae]
MYCNMCQSSMPALRRSYRQGHIRALVKHVTRSSCAKFYSWKHCAQVTKWFDAHYDELIRLLTASTTCNDLKFCRTDASMPL